MSDNLTIKHLKAASKYWLTSPWECRTRTGPPWSGTPLQRKGANILTVRTSGTALQALKMLGPCADTGLRRANKELTCKKIDCVSHQ
jgi:hypothetical protein